LIPSPEKKKEEEEEEERKKLSLFITIQSAEFIYQFLPIL